MFRALTYWPISSFTSDTSLLLQKASNYRNFIVLIPLSGFFPKKLTVLQLLKISVTFMEPNLCTMFTAVRQYLESHISSRHLSKVLEINLILSSRIILFPFGF
jgi:hypothetical protein